MSASLKVIAQYGTPEEAHLLRNRLEEAGFRVFLENETTAAWAWHFANALGGVKILVPEESVSAAKEILAARPQERTPAVAAPTEDDLFGDRPPASWTCPACRVEVDVNMDVCWACGTTVEGMEPPEFPDGAAPEAEPEERGAPPPDVAFLTVLFPPTFAYFWFTKLCQLFAPLVPDAKHHAATGISAPEATSGVEAGDALRRVRHCEEPSREAPRPRSEGELDVLVLRAWRAAWMGLFLLPPLLMTLYSTWLLVTYWFRRCGADRRRDRRAFGAFLVNLAAACFVGFFLSLAMASFHDRVSNEPGVTGPAQEERAPYGGH